MKHIIRLLFHVLAHIYHNHFKEIVLLNLHSHLNCIFAHLVLFNDRFKLVEEKEVEVLEDLAVALKLHAYLPESSPITPSTTPEPSTSGCQALLEMQRLAASGTPQPPELLGEARAAAAAASTGGGRSVSRTGVFPSGRSFSPNNNSPFKEAIPVGVQNEQFEAASASAASLHRLHDNSLSGGYGSRLAEEQEGASSSFNDPNDNRIEGLRPTEDEAVENETTGSAFFAGHITGNVAISSQPQPLEPLIDSLNRRHEINRRSTSASAILLSCSSEPSLPSVHENRRSNSGGNGYGSHPYHHYHPPHHNCASRSTGHNRVGGVGGVSFFGLDAPALLVSSSAANAASPIKYL